MKNKKISIIIIAIISTILILVPNLVKSATINPAIKFGVSRTKDSADSGMLGFSINDPADGGSPLYNIVKYTSDESGYDYMKNMYCIKAGKGFQSNTPAVEKQEYNVSYNMKTDENDAKSTLDYKDTNVNVDGVGNVNAYKALLALGDLLYVSGTDDRNTFLKNAGCDTDTDSNYALKDEQIWAVQQAAIWFFTNSEGGDIYNHYGATNANWLFYTNNTNASSYSSLLSYMDNGISAGQSMARNAQYLYDYLIRTAATNATNSVNNNKKILTMYNHNTNSNTTQPLMEIQRIKEFDLALRKYITKVNGQNVTNSRIPSPDKSKIETNNTADYKHRKDPVEVKTGNTVTYNLSIYNEGDIAGRATEITDQLPTGLKFKQVNTQGFTGTVDSSNKLIITRNTSNTENLEAYDGTTLDSEIIEIECEVIATADSSKDKILTNIAWISKEYNAETNTEITDQEGADRDSEPSTAPSKTANELVTNDIGDIGKDSNSGKDISSSDSYFEGQQDDDDFEKVVLKPLKEFDLKLIKRITAVNSKNVEERLEKVDVSNLNISGANSQTTATYKMNKKPVKIKKGDLVTYTFRIYNEGYADGYAEEITEDIPEGLEFVVPDNWTDDNTLTEQQKEEITKINGIWEYTDSTLKKIKTTYLSEANGEILEPSATTNPNLIKAFGENDGTKTEEDLDYREVSVILKVVSENLNKGIIRNEACISDDADASGNDVDDRDSKPEDWNKEDDDKYYDDEKQWPVYKEDDEDYDNIILQQFDLALRKFITQIGKQDVDTRIPQVKYDEENNKISYEHSKDPLDVVTGDIVTYTIRVFNEGEINGYAEEVMDDIPDGLEFLPENETNTNYRWKMYEEITEGTSVEDETKVIERDGKKYIETTDAKKASIITTDYLSKKQGEARKEENNTQENPNLLTAFDSSKPISDENPAYRDVQVAFKVIEPNGSDKIIVNSAQISEDADEDGNSVDDIDSKPGEWNDGEDDQDKEYIKLTYFDLALRKWVTEAIVIEDGKETVTQTGHTAEMDPEPPVKVELHRKKLSKVTVKFRYSIRITNEGDIAGYAKEITDYVPEGLKFVAEDNKGWTDEGNNVISTRLLENTLLQPGESAEVTVLLTWINGENNIGLKTNTAEISEDYNDKGVPDRDSTPDNKKPGEDDIDDAPVILSIETGQARIYFILGFTILITLSGGIVLIKKFVL